MVIPAILNELDARLAHSHFASAPAFWIRAERIQSLPAGVSRSRVWLDFELDGCHHEASRRRDSWRSRIAQLEGGPDLLKTTEDGGVKQGVAERIATSMLHKAHDLKVGWITLPQLPISGDALREKDNRVLADGAGESKRQGTFRGRRVLPVTFTHREQIGTKTARKQRVQRVVKLAEAADADAVWVCDSSLSEREGTSSFDKERFPDLIDFHMLLRAALPKRATVIAGPYWGIGLVLWARGLVDYPMALVGRTAPYYFAGGIGYGKPTPRVALPPLRRVIDATAASRKWLHEALRTLAPDDPVRREFELVDSRWSLLASTPAAAQTQIAEFYSAWTESLAAAPAAGRAIALYQDFSSAYVIGRQFPDIGGVSGPGKRPERIAQQYMMHCL